MATKLNAVIKGFYRTVTLEALFLRVTEDLTRAREETIREFFKRVRKAAIRNIDINNAETGVPRSGRLERSIRYNTRARRMTVGGENAPYATTHDSGGEGPGYTLLFPKKGKYLVFFNHRTGQVNKRRSVKMPTYDFFSSAWYRTAEEIPEIFDSIVKDTL